MKYSTYLKAATTLLFLLLLNTIVTAQETYTNCDSLRWVTSGPYDFYHIQMPKPLNPDNQLLDEFYSKIDKSKMTDKIFVNVVIDESGDVCCPKIEKGNNNETDDAVNEYVTKLKFTPAIYEGKNIPIQIVIPIPTPALTKLQDY